MAAKIKENARKNNRRIQQPYFEYSVEAKHILFMRTTEHIFRTRT